MNYISLYRKWRSQNFNEIVGQKHIVQTLKNAISMKRLSHAYLFTGPRGTGKTSLARILAKALNCEKGISSDPCGRCSACQKIRDGSAVDVSEIDAASNRGIDEIRDLREKIRYLPVEGRYKIYIIDEVHMLTQEAFNALLKTLEEPPEHVVFVLATTEPTRVPITISSRCQRLDFERISVAEIKEQLIKIAKAEGIDIDNKALELIARAAEGSLRDAISLLDQLISFAGNKVVSNDVVVLLGGAGEEMLYNMSKAIALPDVKAALSCLQEAIDAGRSALQIARDMIGFYRNLLLVKLGSGEALELSGDSLKRFEEEAEKYELDRIKEILKAIAKAEMDMKWHSQARILFEVALIELLGECKTAAPCAVAISEPVNVDERPSDEKRIAPDDSLNANATDQRLVKIKKHWNEIMEAVKKRSLFGYVSLHEGHPVEVTEQNKLIVNFGKGFAFHKERLEDRDNKAMVEDAMKEVTGESIGIVCRIGDSAAPSISVDAVAEIFEGELI